MDVVLLGTAGADGFPVTGCGCASCCLARDAGVRRAPARLSVDGRQFGPGPARVITGAGGRRVLWAPDAGEAGKEPDGVLDVAVLGCTGERPAAAHLLAGLRGCGAVTGDTDVVLVGLGHHRPADLALRAAAWGARLVDDGAVLGAGGDLPAWPRRTLVLGPASSGKSALAEDLLAARPAVRYLATGPAPGPDSDWSARVAAHRARRPQWWRTVETDRVAAELSAPGAPILLDAVGTWLTGAMERSGAWQQAAGWTGRLADEADGLVSAWRDTRAPVIAVSEEVGWGVVPPTPAGRLFRNALGDLNRRLAEQSERVLLVVAGRVVPLTGGAPLTGGWCG